jgi:hypothetical protein
MELACGVHLPKRLPVCRRFALALLTLVAMAGWTPLDSAEAQVSVVGEWRTLGLTVPINPIHVALLRTGRVLIVAGSENDPTVTTYRASVWNPVTGAFATQTVPWDLFCNAMTFLPDGRVLTVGGNVQYNPFRGMRTTTVFDPVTEQFSQVQDMARGRWYPSNLALADGRTMTFSGWTDTGGTNQAVQFYTVPDGWSAEFPAPFTPPLYPWLHLLPDGRVFESGAQTDSHIFDPITRTWTTGVAETLYTEERTFGSSVLLPLRPAENYRARIMIMGGDNPATDSAEIIDLSQPSPAWRALPSMSAPRIQMNAVLLPTGKVLALGGSSQNNNASTASLNAELFDPDTETWSPAGRMGRPRLYHSVALLLPDATVWVAGSNPQQGTWDNTIEIYRPPYLFAPGGGPAVQPSIGVAPAAVGYNAAFQVTTPNAADIASVALVRPGSSTHAFNFEQRLVELTFTASNGNLALTSPPSANIAPPGYYMLFLINRAGVPSKAAWVRLAPDPDNQAPVGTISSPTAGVTIESGQSVTFAGSGTDPDGTVTEHRWSFPGGTPATSTSATPGAVTYSKPGTFDAVLTVTDNLGATDPSPPRRRITVLPAGLAASFTTPTAGATLAGTQPVGMVVDNTILAPTTFTLTIDGTEVFSTTTSASSVTFDWNTTTVPDGLHTLGLTARNGTATAIATRTVTVNNGGTPLNDIKVSFPGLSPGQTVQGVTTVRIAADNTAGASNRFAISVDGAAQDLIVTGASTVDWAWNTAPLASGSHTISVTVTDATGRRGIGTEFVTVQNTLGVIITSPAPGATLSGQAWANVWVERFSGTSNAFALTVGGRVVASQTIAGRHATLAWDTRQVPNGPQTMVATVVDATNNGGLSTSRTVNVQNPLAASFTSPVQGAMLAGNITVGLAASGGTAPYTYRLTVDGTQLFTTTNTSDRVSFTWNTTTGANGPRTLSLTITDAQSVSASAERGVTVQNASTLAASFTAPAANATVAGTVAVGLAGGGIPPYTYRLTVDGTQRFTTTTSITTASFTWNTTTVPNGGHILGLTVTDSVGGSASATRSVNVSNPPSVALTSPASGSIVSGTAWVNIWVTRVVAGSKTYTMTVGGTTVWSQTSTATHVTLPWITTGTPNGPQTLVASVRDAAGNTGSASVSVTVQNGSPPLAAAFTSPAAGASVAGMVTVGLAGSGGTAPYTYRLTIDGAQIFSSTTSAISTSSTWNTTTALDGSHTLGLTVTDSAGGSASATRTVTVANANTNGTDLRVSLTSPLPGSTVRGTAWVNIWVDGAAAGSKTYTLKVGDTTVWNQISAANHVTLPWVTTSTPNGTRTLVVTVHDTASATGTASVTVTVTNP